jgi:cystathionine gamma-lyase
MQAIISIARSHPARPLVLVDNTFLSPYYASPLLLGADVVMHSISKYINGHSDVIMGALILPARHAALAEKLRFLQNAIGAIPSPFDCWLAQRGTKTLHLRMQAHGMNALAVAKALKASPYVKDVIYPGLASHPRHEIAYKSLSPHARKWIDSLPGTERGKNDFPFGGVISIRIATPPSSTAAAAARKFLATTKLFLLAESLGGVESLAELPADMTHATIPEEERELLGIGSDLIRLSVGLEEPDDLVADVEQALHAAFHSKGI